MEGEDGLEAVLKNSQFYKLPNYGQKLSLPLREGLFLLIFGNPKVDGGLVTKQG